MKEVTVLDKKTASLIVGTVVLSLIAGYIIGYYHHPLFHTENLRDKCNDTYFLLRSDLDCTVANDEYERVSKIQDLLNQYIDNEKSNGNVSRVSVFFRDLSSRRWAAIEQGAQYAPGSLLKVPLAVAYFKLSEIEPQVLTDTYEYSPTSKNTNDVENFKPSVSLVPGQKYTVLELIEQMIVYSDNEATVLLNSSIDQTFLKMVLNDLGVHLPTSGGGEQNFITTKDYSNILRGLYLSSYLNIENSQKLLELMSKTSFNIGIASGVPNDITVAHKFGERAVTNSVTGTNMSSELHDCGIVYKKENPYILCVMTEGDDYKKLTTVLSEISKLVYDIE